MFDDVIKVDANVNNADWIGFGGPVFISFDSAHEFLEDSKRGLVDQTRLVGVTEGTFEHSKLKNCSVHIYDASKSNVLAYTTVEISGF